jgi:amidophosphoribosyltransferase
LIAANHSVDEIQKYIGADSLAYLSKESLYWFEKSSSREWFCDACFTGNYPEGPEFVRRSLAAEGRTQR